MTSPRASYLADPTIQHLPRLLQEIRDGLLVFPRFQRPTVWTQQQRIELFRSVLRGVPIGTVMVWRTNQTIPSFDRLGRLKLPSRAQKAASGRQYVLDGLQRLSTLYRELIAPAADDESAAGSDDQAADDSEEYFPILVDLGYELEEVCLIDTADSDYEDPDVRERSLRLSDSLNSAQFMRRLRELDALENGAEFVERAEAVVSRLREYKVPVVPFVSESVQEVTRAFQLVNSQGTPMSTMHMVNALAWIEDFVFLDEIERCKGELGAIGWASIDETVLLRCFAVAVGLEGYEYDPEEFARTLVEQRDRSGDRVIQCLKRVAKVLREQCGIDSPGLVPYSVQILILFSTFLGTERNRDGQKELAASWLWYTTYLEAFRGSTSSSMISRVTEDLKLAMRGKKKLEWKHRGKNDRRSFPQAFDFRHARSRALALLLARELSKAAGGDRAPFKLLATHGAEALANVVPGRNRTGAWSQRVGCRFLVDPAESGDLVAMLKRGPDAAEELSGHFVSKAALKLYAEGKYREFVELRSRTLEASEVEHFDSVKHGLGLG